MVDKKNSAIAVLCVVTILCLGLWANETQEVSRLKGGLYELEGDYEELALVRTSLEKNYSELRTEKEDLEIEYSTLEKGYFDLEDEKDTLKAEYSIIKREYDSLKSHTRNYEVNVTRLAINLMAKRSTHIWEEGYYNPDIQGLIVVRVGTSWANNIYEELSKEFQKRGGGVISVRRFAFETISDLWPREMVEDFLNGEYGPTDYPYAFEFIDTYGLDHIAILYLGGSESYFLSKRTKETPKFDELPLIVIVPETELQFMYLENPPWEKTRG